MFFLTLQMSSLQDNVLKCRTIFSFSLTIFLSHDIRKLVEVIFSGRWKEQMNKISFLHESNIQSLIYPMNRKMYGGIIFMNGLRESSVQ